MKAKQNGDILAVLMVILVVAFGIWIGFYVRDHRKDKTSVATGTSQQSANHNQPLSSGTDNSSLDSDLQDINSGLNQGSQNLDSSNSALNDQQLPVSD